MKFGVFVFGICITLAMPTMSQGTVNLALELADSTAEVVPVKVGLSFSEGPAVDSAGNIFFSENPNEADGRIWKIFPDGTEEVFYENANWSNGLEFGPRGRLHSCQSSRLVRWEKNGDITELASDSLNSEIFGLINDLSIGSNGSIYFSNLNGGKVFHLDASGNLKSFDFNRPNGVEWLEEENTLYISYSGRLNKCTTEANGDISNCRDFTSGRMTPDGLTLDELGNVYLADWGSGQVRVFDSSGIELGYIEVESEEVPEANNSPGQRGNTSNCSFGGPEGKTLYITGDGGLYKVEMKVKGRQKPHPTAISKRTIRFAPYLAGAQFVAAENFANWLSQTGLRDAKLYDMANGKIKTYSRALKSGAYSLLGTDKNGTASQLSFIITP